MPPYEFTSSDCSIQDQDTEQSPWDDAPFSSCPSTAHAEAEWTKLSSDFQTAGYRDGITAGKEGALQEGFDAGFAQAGAPRGRELGLLRGLASALLLHLSRLQTRTQTQTQPQTEEREREQAKAAATLPAVREIVNALAAVRFADIAPAPPPDEAEHQHQHQHQHMHGSDEGKGEEGGEGEERRTSVGLGPSARSISTRKPTIEDVRALRVKLETLLREAGLKVDLKLEPIP